MPGELSGGLAALRTAGNRVVRADTGAIVTLRGINRSGLEYSGPDEQGFLSGAGICRSEIEIIARQWRSNVIRLPFNQDFALRGRAGHAAEAYLRALDQCIAWASACGAYTLLDLQWLDADRIYGGNRNFVAPLPNVDSIALWTTLARRYRGEPAVLYDLFTEPHDRLPDDPFPLNKPDGSTYPAAQRRVTMAEWQPWAGVLAAAVRAENPDALVFIAGTDWAYDLRGMPMDLPGAVYSTHVYAEKGDNWDEAFGDLSAAAPVFAGEFGGAGTPAGLDFGRRLIDYLEARGIGWAAWSWFNDPLLVARYTATPFGELVRGRLTG